VKKGRHRRYEEARMAKRAFVKPVVRCVECNGDSVRGHADWCMAASEEEQLLEEGELYSSGALDDDDDDEDEEDDDDDDDDEYDRDVKGVHRIIDGRH
ncbi:unnamed protein product, partial [Acidithrix sp. C25]